MRCKAPPLCVSPVSPKTLCFVSFGGGHVTDGRGSWDLRMPFKFHHLYRFLHFDALGLSANKSVRVHTCLCMCA